MIYLFPITAGPFECYDAHISPEIIKLILSLTPVPATSGAALSSFPAAPPGLISLANQRGNTALHWAALNGHLEAAKALIESGAEIGRKNLAGHNAAFEAEQAGKEEVAAWLISAGDDGQEGDVKEEEVSGELEADTNMTAGPGLNGGDTVQTGEGNPSE